MKRKAIYTDTEMSLNEEALRHPLRLLEATWITGTGPRGGKVSIGKGRYDALDMMVIEKKAEVVARWRAEPHYANLTLCGIVIRFFKVKKNLTEAVQTTAHHDPGVLGGTGVGPLPWEQ